MTRIKKLAALLGVLVVICAATLVAVKYEDKKEEIKTSGETVLSIPYDSVTEFSWEYDNTSLSFRKDEEWLYTEDERFPVDQEIIEGMLKQFEAVGAAFIIENVEDYSQYGLDEPECTINISADETDYVITLGDFSNMDQQRYISIDDGNVYLVTVDPFEKLEAELSDIIKHDETPLFGDITDVVFEGEENYSIFYEAESINTYCEDDVYFIEKGGNTVPLDTDSVESYTGKISNLVLEDYVTYNATEEELASFGLDNPQLKVTVKYEDVNDEGETEIREYVLNVGRDTEELKALEEAEEKSDEEDKEETITAYARVGDSQIVYEITDSDYKNLMAADYNDLRHKELFTANLDYVYQIDVVLEDSIYTLTSETEDDETVWYYDEEEFDITNFRSQLGDIEATEFTEENPSDKKEVDVTFHLNNENYPQINIELYRYDGEKCLARIDGETVSFVSRSAVVDFIEAVNNIVLNG